MKKFLIFSLLFGFVQMLSAQNNMNLLGELTYNQELSDIWGYVDSVGNEYAIVGVYNGVSVVDVTDPANPNELFFFPGPSSIWRDIKTWDKHAYITNDDGNGGGLFIIDLSNLPDTTTPATSLYTGSSYQFSRAHNLYIDENGVAYIMGANYNTGGAIFLDLTIDPMNPVELGLFDNYYLHDGMARGDTLWGGAINDGFLIALDVSNKSNPQILGTKNTPHNFTHNCWISDDGNTLFTTDEKSNAFIAAYDVSNVSNITELDRIRSNDGSGVIPHNTHFMNDYVITSYYKDGVTIHDVSRPGNMVEVGNYDSYSQGSGDGFNGAWGVYPWLPSGNVIVSDINNGLHILGATYVRGCYLEGQVTALGSGNPIPNATVEILTASASTSTNIFGDYDFGISTAGSYQVVFSASGYNSDTLLAILSNGVLTILDAQLDSLTPFSIPGNVTEVSFGSPVSGANIRLENDNISYDFISDGAGNFSLSSIFGGTYNIVAGKWGYITKCFSMYIDSSTTSLSISLDTGLYDDFSFDFGWTETGTANKGEWERGEPNGTSYNGSESNPGEDVDSDCLGMAYITGNSSSGGVGDDDVDDGTTILSSPVFDLGNYNDPYLSYYRWFFNDGGFSGPNDTLFIRLDNGSTTVTIETVSAVSSGNSTWVYNGIRIGDYITPTSTMLLEVIASDLQGGHLVEAGFDKFWITDDGLPPVPSISSDLNAICVLDTIANNGVVQFSDNSTGGGLPSWTFEGGTPGVSSSSNPSIEYLNPGTYDVTLTVTNISGTVTTVWQDYIVVYDPPVADFSVDEDTVCLNSGNFGAVQFTNTSTSESSYYWDFGDGDTSVSQNPVNTYDIVGTYIASLTTSNPGCTATATSSIYVDICLGLDKYNKTPSTIVYPNPFSASLNLSYSFKELHENGGASVQDLSGRELLYVSFEHKQGNIQFGADLPAGIYIVKLSNGTSPTESIKVVKL